MTFTQVNQAVRILLWKALALVIAAWSAFVIDLQNSLPDIIFLVLALWKCY